MTKYDPSVIVEFADYLYAQAASVVLGYTVVGILAGGGIGAVIGTMLGEGVIPIVIGAAIVGVIAAQLGRQKAFALRLQAQVALCQVQIEANTRTGQT
ncbi:MAG TPA: hypothetical protein VFV49_05755 [Thermoanaerobaculia bacterium]|nr:hypothetical protein [Thermoanaerobaculia bacterium]